MKIVWSRDYEIFRLLNPFILAAAKSLSNPTLRANGVYLLIDFAEIKIFEPFCLICEQERLRRVNIGPRNIRYER